MSITNIYSSGLATRIHVKTGARLLLILLGDLFEDADTWVGKEDADWQIVLLQNGDDM